jgi:cytoplasmic iron level regulating protein YaaA (DUF328/UPF0246 family)
MRQLKINIITSCTGEKLHSPDDKLKAEDFQVINDLETFRMKEGALNAYRTRAEEIYTGQQHIRLMKGVKLFREKFGEENLNLWILSAGYGLIEAKREVVPYECTFQGMKAAEVKRWSDHLNIPEAAHRVLAGNADLTIVLLGDSYLKALQMDESFTFGAPTIFLASNGSQKLIKVHGKTKVIPFSNREAKRYSCGLVALKGEITTRILRKLTAEGSTFIDTLFNSDDALSLFDEVENGSAVKQVRQSPRANPEVDKVISIPESWWEKPHRKKLRYFIPEWDDLVDPDYDFETDTHSGGSGDWSNEVYAHQIYTEPNYDGILISKVVAEKSAKKKERINRMGVHRFLRVPDNFPVMGDCGAFGYIMDEVPPYTTQEILEYYTRLGFNYGVSLDHLIVKATEQQKQFRYELTINNAEEFLVEHRRLELDWQPIGAVQGWDPRSYADAARKYVAMGYKYIALGGLVRTHSSEIAKILQEVHRVVPSDVDIHLFGIARFQFMKDFYELGVRSVDSASMLRKAWLGSDLNFLSKYGWYSAIRVPQSNGSHRAKKIVADGVLSFEELEKLEKSCLKGLREYDKNGNNRPSETLLRDLVEYDTLVAGERKKTKERIERTLTDKPWQSCGCEICKTWGIEVAIFRGNNRNRRRGFHNTHVFYDLIQRKLNGENIDWLEPEDKTESVTQPTLFEIAGT